MNHLHWMPLYIGDELAATGQLFSEEFGAYMLLKMHYWQHGSLPVEEDRIARIARVEPSRWPAIKAMIYPLFGPAWRSDRMDALRKEAEDKHKKRVEAGKKGGRPRLEEKQCYNHSFSEGKALPNQTQPQPHSYLQSKSNSDHLAWDDEGGTNTREGRSSMFLPLDPPASPKIAAQILKSRGVPAESLSGAIHRFMNGKLSEYDIEGLINGEVQDATA